MLYKIYTKWNGFYLVCYNTLLIVKMNCNNLLGSVNDFANRLGFQMCVTSQVTGYDNEYVVTMIV